MSTSPNLAARWARNIIRSTPARYRLARMLLFGLIVLAWLGLTGVGSYLVSTEPTFWRKLVDALYGPFTFLAPQDGYLNGNSNSALQSNLLWYGRLFGSAVPVIAIVWAWLHLSRMAIARMLMRCASGHIVILGRDGAADAIASCSSRKDNNCVVLVESRVSDERARELEAAGVLVATGGIREALTQFHADRAECVLAWSRHDASSIADAVNATRAIAGSSEEIAVHVESAETQRALRHAPELLQSDRGRLRPISITLSAVRMALRDHALVDEARKRGQERVHVALHGGTAALQAAAVMVLRHNWSIHLRAPRVSHVEPSDGRWAAWADYHRTLFQNAESVLRCAPNDLVRAGSRRSLAEDRTVTRHIVDHGEDGATLRAAFNLASELAQLHEKNPPRVQPVLRDADAAEALIGSSTRFAPIILLSDDRTVASLVARAEDEEAARVHLDYLAGEGGDAGAASVPWHRLAETFVHANRAAADHNAVKRFDIAEARAAGLSTADLREALARTEHDRWSIERLLDGWAPGERSNDRLIHNNLVTWGELSEAVKLKDYIQIDRLLKANST